MKNVIKLSESNYKKYLPINIMAFSYATSGAQGDPGAVKIIDNDGKIYYFNYVDQPDLKENEIYEICPPLKGEDNEKWGTIYMGAGNTLFVNEPIFPEVKDKAKGLRGSELYQRWRGIILSIIKK